MQVDSSRHSPPVFGGIEDFLNMDMLTSQAAASSSSGSSASSHSPRSPPPQTSFDWPSPVINTGSPSDFFNFFSHQGESEYTPFVAPTKTAFDFDYMNTLAPFPYTLGASSSPETSSSADLAGNAGIDPQLVGTPTTTIQSDFEAEDGSQPASALLVIPEEEELVVPLEEPVAKAGGKGRGARKGTVAAGGITKKASGPSFLRDKDSGSLHGDDDDEDDSWRPTAEEYKKMSSKEKRQLRNKISARNFRVRRKEYITTLESHLAERDSLLQTIRTELASSNNENGALRAEIAALKRTLMNQPISALPPPGPLPSASAPLRSSPPPSSPTLASVNTSKDLPTSPRLNAKSYAFWGGAGSAGINMGGGYTPVHTMRTMSVSEVLARKANENMNPLLSAPVDPSPFSAPSRININPKDNATRDLPGFDAFIDRTPFTMRALDAYRMQLWQKVGSSAPQQQQQNANTNTHTPLTGLAANLRPAYFQAQPPRSVLSSSTSRLNGASTTTTNAVDLGGVKEEAIMANIASQTLVKRLGGAFWDAFSGSSSTGPDVEKVKKVLEGKAVLRYVDLEAPAPLPTVVVKKEVMASPKMAHARECNFGRDIADILEVNMRSLTLAAKK